MPGSMRFSFMLSKIREAFRAHVAFRPSPALAYMELAIVNVEFGAAVKGETALGAGESCSQLLLMRFLVLPQVGFCFVGIRAPEKVALKWSLIGMMRHVVLEVEDF